MLAASTRLSLTKGCGPCDWVKARRALRVGGLGWSKSLCPSVRRDSIGRQLVRLLLGLLRPFVWRWQTPFSWKTRSRRGVLAGKRAFRLRGLLPAASVCDSESLRYFDMIRIYQIAPKVIAEAHKEWRERLAAFELQHSRSEENSSRAYNSALEAIGPEKPAEKKR